MAVPSARPIAGNPSTAATLRLNGIIEPVTVRFDGKGCELWLKGEILPMRLHSEEIGDPAAVTVYDGKREFVLKVDLDN